MFKNIAKISKGYSGYRNSLRCRSTVTPVPKLPESADVVIIGKNFHEKYWSIDHKIGVVLLFSTFLS